MKKAGILVVVVLGCLILTGAAQAAEKRATMMAHNVFFSLTEKSEAARAKLVDACHKYLKEHPGVVFFAAGTLAADYDREVNDRDFDVALHIVFKTKEDHDRYQVDAKHKQFIEENRAGWAKVRVFDSYVK